MVRPLLQPLATAPCYAPLRYEPLFVLRRNSTEDLPLPLVHAHAHAHAHGMPTPLTPLVVAGEGTVGEGGARGAPPANVDLKQEV
jgi:hypothetical protein